MNENEVRERAWAMPLTSPIYPRGPYRFMKREFLVISYRTDPKLLRTIVPAPLKPAGEGIVKMEFIRMPDSTGFGDYTESGQVIPVTFKGRPGTYSHNMFLNDDAPIAGGREIWGFPKKLANPSLRVDKDVLVGTLDYGDIRVATGTMGYKHIPFDPKKAFEAVTGDNYLLKIIPHVDCTPRICELVRYRCQDVTIHGAWQGPAALQLFEHALAPVAQLPVLEVVGAVHILTDLTLGLGEVVHDYLAK
ncbi:MAG: acetoacetate decarboxylase [Castellaniella sp.]|uniref:acetoacetate decarboxylase n=1 Tax=Castellaniella sp. TaxID=1955812 RepID=UPI0011F93483|nr:acetoacetate decarboxylase [Castellaniella sp.]TAN28076.1 MAG: acetoacetate decarboxylase [Castellaniella sp.]